MRHEVYHASPTLVFILTETHTFAKTPTQTFSIRYDHGNYKARLERLRERIRQGKFKTLYEVVEFCGWKPGNYKGFMDGLEMVATTLERHGIEL